MNNINNEELNKEIEKYKLVGRNERRKAERMLQKKYNDKSIRILSGKKFKKSPGLNKEQRRNLVKDKNLVLELMKIITKYLPQLTPMFSELTDKRNKSYIKFNMKTIIMTRLFALLCGITTMKGINQEFNTEETIRNLSEICSQNLKEVPDWQTVQDVIEGLSIDEICAIRKYIVTALIRSKMFDRFRYKNRLQLLVDATGLSSHDYNLNGNCLTKTKNGKTKYYKYVLEAKLVFKNNVISLDSEWIENTELNNENDKQDCEINAFKRMVERIHKEYPKYRFIITGDALYACEPMINICKDNHWDYIFNFKKSRLKNAYEQFEDNLNYENETSKENYYLSSNIQHKSCTFTAIRYDETKDDKITSFSYVTNLKVTNSNITEIVAMGRRRWKIENECFNEQKNGTFCISHLCSRNENALKIHYLFIQIAHIIRQLLEYSSLILRAMKLGTKKEVSQHITQALTSGSITLKGIELGFQLRFE